MIYMDHNATTPILPSVLSAMQPWLTYEFGNASSAHGMGHEAREAVEKARGLIAKALGAERREIFFTSGGTEADNWALQGSLYAEDGPEVIVTSAIEHHAILKTCERLAPGVETRIVGVGDSGRLDVAALGREFELLSDRRLLVSVMHANNETGTIQPIPEVAFTAHQIGAIVHSDACQTFGKIPFTVDDLGVDMLTISAHKIGGPKGVGALYVRHGTPLVPMISGGHQEFDMRAGTENVAGIVGFGAAVQGASEHYRHYGEICGALARSLVGGVLNALDGVRRNGHPKQCIPNTVNLSFKGVDSEALVLLLDQQCIAVSNGAACESGLSEPSHVLMAMGRSEEDAMSAIRFSLGYGNSYEDIVEVVAALGTIIPTLRGMG